MKILMIAPTPFFADRGCHVRILGEAIALRSLNNNVIISTYHNGQDTSNLKIRRIFNIPWYSKLEAGPSYHMLYLDPLLMLYSLKESISFNPDVIHAHLHEGVLIGNFCSLAKLNRLPLIFDAQGSLTGEMISHGFITENGIKYNFFLKLEKILNKMADAIIVSSSNMAEMFVEKFGIEKEKIKVIIDGVDTDIFTGDIDASDLRKTLKISPRKKVVVYTGILNEYQGIDYLLKSISVVVEDLKDVCFLIVGFPNVEHYKNMARKLEIDEYVKFVGKVDHKKIPEFLSLGDVAVSPKISESGEANLKLFEYISSRLPTVVFDTPVNREILGNLGIYAKNKDPHSLGENIKEILLDEKKAKKLGAKLRKKAVDQHSWLKVGEKIIKVYGEVCS
jgi:glycosyltransferase involved in cell wall biosynthesis